MTTSTRGSRLFPFAIFFLLSVSVVGCGSSSSGLGLPTAPSSITAPLSLTSAAAAAPDADSGPAGLVELAQVPEGSLTAVSEAGKSKFRGEGVVTTVVAGALDDVDAEAVGPVENLSGTCPTRTFLVVHDRVTTSSADLTRYEDVSCETLRDGQVVKVEGMRQPDGSILAGKVERRDARPPVGEVEVRGVISKLGGTCPEKTFDLGADPVIHVITSASTRYDDVTCAELANGQSVKVEGTRQSDGSILARKIERRRDGPGPGGEVEVRGVIRNLVGTCDAKTFDLGADHVITSASTRYDDTSCEALRNGMRVEVKGYRQANGSVLAKTVEVEEQEVELKGLVSGRSGNCPNLTFIVNGTTVATNGSTKFEGGCSAVQNGKKVEVEGYRQANGSVLAKVVEIDE